MGVISTSTINVFVSGTTIEPSDTIKVFDTIYDVVNGGLDAANLASAFTIDSSSVTITDTATFLTATLTNVIQQELTHKGWNTVHVLGFGTAGMSLFPGIIEVNGKYCKVNSRINFSGINNINIINSSTSKVWIVSLPQVVNITSSDMQLTELTGSDAYAFNYQKNGWYNVAGNRRALCTLRCDITASTGDSYFDDQYLQRPSIGHRYTYAAAEKQGLGFVASGSLTLQDVTVFLDMDTMLRAFELKGVHADNTGAHVAWFDSSVSGKMLFGAPFHNGAGAGNLSGTICYHYIVHSVQNEYGAPGVYEFSPGRKVINEAGSELGYFNFNFTNGTSTFAIRAMNAVFFCSNYNLIIKRRSEGVPRRL